MARGFATGFVHGALLCGAGLAALSLAVPIPRDPLAEPKERAALLHSPAPPEQPAPGPDSVDVSQPASEAPIPVPPPGKVAAPQMDGPPARAIEAPPVPGANQQSGP